jgi:replication factor C subunit 3/5
MSKCREICIPWVEKYRPSKMIEIVLEPLNRELFTNILDMNYFPNLLIYGPPGCGKTTIIQNMINEHQTRYSQVNKSNIIHLNASDERGIDIIRNQIHQFVKSNNLFVSGLKFVILDEVDYMTKNAQQGLKYILQTSNYNVRFCLICNYITKIDESLKNEFLCIRFNQLPKRDIIVFMKEIAEKEELSLPDDLINTIMEMFNSDVRSMINYIQLNQNIVNDKSSELKIMNKSVYEGIYQWLREADKNSLFPEYIHGISVNYNVDKRTIIQKFLKFIICNHKEVVDSNFLKSIEIILHRHDIPIEAHLNFLLFLFLENHNLKN